MKLILVSVILVSLYGIIGVLALITDNRFNNISWLGIICVTFDFNYLLGCYVWIQNYKTIIIVVSLYQVNGLLPDNSLLQSLNILYRCFKSISI